MLKESASEKEGRTFLLLVLEEERGGGRGEENSRRERREAASSLSEVIGGIDKEDKPLFNLR